MTERIEPPKIAAHHPDRGIDCEFALEPAFQALVEAAEEAAWSAAEVCAALIGLADAHELGRNANAATDEQIDRPEQPPPRKRVRHLPWAGRVRRCKLAHPCPSRNAP